MSYQIPDKTSIDTLIAYTATTVASLQSMDETQKLATPWTKLLDEIKTERAACETDEFALLAASARVKVWDARWDSTLTEISSRAYLAAKKNANAEPYVSLFGGIKAGDAIRLGPHKATTFGNTILAKLREQKHAELMPLIAPFEKLNTELVSAAAARGEALERNSVHRVRRYRLIESIEALIAQTEIGVLTALPGQRNTARAVLSFSSHMRKTTHADDKEQVSMDSTMDTTISRTDDV